MQQLQLRSNIFQADEKGDSSFLTAFNLFLALSVILPKMAMVVFLRGRVVLGEVFGAIVLQFRPTNVLLSLRFVVCVAEWSAR